jgi:hypothetical protein
MSDSVRRLKTFTVSADRLLFDGHNAGIDGDVHIEMSHNDGKCVFGSDLTVEEDKKILLNNIHDADGNEVFDFDNNKVTVEYANGVDFNNKSLDNANIDSGTVDGISSLSFESGASVSFAGATNGIDFGNNTITNFNLPASSLEPNSIGSNNGFSTLEDELDQNRSETLTALNRTQAPHLSANKVLISNGSGLLISSNINPSDVIKTTDVLAASQIPNLSANKITSDTLGVARIPSLPASQTTSGTFDVARIPSLAASQTTSGTFDVARIPSLAASQTTSGTFDAARIPSLAASQTTSGTFDAARIPNLDASKITSGTINDSRLNSNILRDDVNNQTLSANGFTIDGGNSGNAVLTLKADGDNNNGDDNAFIDFLQDGGTVGTSTGTRGRIGLDGVNNMFCGITSDSFFFGGLELRTHGSGTTTNYKPVSIKAHGTHSVNLDHLGINILSGYNLRMDGSNFGFNHLRSGSVATEAQIPNLSANKITSDTLGIDRIPTLTAVKIPNLSADKITTDTLGVDRIPNLSANKITTDVLGIARIPDLSTDKITTGTFSLDRIPTLTAVKIPNLSADKITTDTLGIDRIPTLTAAKIPDLSANKITSDTLGIDRIPTLTAAKIPNLSADKITTDTLGIDRIPTLTAAKIPDLSANKITSDTLGIDRIPTLTNAKLPTNIETNTLTVDRIRFNQASNATDSTTSPSIHDYNDSLIFDVLNGERYSFKVEDAEGTAQETVQIHGSGITADNLTVSTGGTTTTDTLKVDTIRFFDSDNSSDDATEPKIFDYFDSLFFEVLSLKKFNFTVGSTAIAEIASAGFNLKSGTYRINGAQISSANLSNDANIIKSNIADQTISQGSSTGSHLRIRHASNLSIGGGADNPNIHVERADALGNVTHRGTIGLDHAHDDIVIKNSDADGGVAIYNNNTDLLFRIDDSGADFKGNIIQSSGDTSLKGTTITGDLIVNTINNTELRGGNVALDTSNDLVKGGVSYGAFERLAQITPSGWTAVAAAGTTQTADNIVFASGFTTLSSTTMKYKVVDHGNDMKQVFLRGAVRKTDNSDMADSTTANPTTLMTLGTNLRPTDLQIAIAGADASLSDHHFHSCLIAVQNDGKVLMWRKLVNSDGTDALTEAGVQPMERGLVETVRVHNQYWTD